MRFVIRISQRNWLRNKKVVDKAKEAVIELEDEENANIENPNQMLIFEDE